MNTFPEETESRLYASLRWMGTLKTYCRPRLCILIALVVILGKTEMRAQHSPPVITTDSVFIRDAKRAVDSLYSLEIESANRIMTTWRQRYPDQPLWPFWDALEVWWKILPDLQDRSLDDRFFELLDRSVEHCEHILDQSPNHPDALLVKALSKGMKARHLSNRGKWLTGLNHARIAIRAFRKLESQGEYLPDLLLGSGLIKYYSAFMKDEYPIVRTFSWMLPSGNRQKGIANLRKAARKSIYVRAEARYFLGKILLNYENEKTKGLKEYQALSRLYPENPYYARLHVRALVQTNSDKQALERIDSLVSNWERESPYYRVLKEELLAWKGRILQKRGKYEPALQALRESYVQAPFLTGRRERPYHIMAGFYIGKIYWIQGEDVKARQYLTAASEVDSDSKFSESARRLLEHMDIE